MSRFGLRSCSDGLKLLEEKNNRRKSSNPTSSTKRIVNSKESKFSVFNNSEENLIDEIKVEADEIEKSLDIIDKCGKNKSAAKVGETEDDDGENNDNDNDNDVENDYRQQSPICRGALVCSLPLDRINEIIQKLNLNKSKVEIEKEADEIMIDETFDNDDDEEDDANISKQSASNVKNLCLYCDRKFSSHKMQLKHVDKFHCLQQDRRCSGRTAQLQQHQIVSRTRKSTTGSQNFPGCNFCQKTKGQSQPVILPAAELSSLFLHLTDCHTDKYFGCKMCVIRFQNISKLSKHMEVVHKSLPFAFDESSSKSKDNDTDSLVSIDKLAIGERSKLSLKRQQRSQKSSLTNCMNISGSSVNTLSTTSQCSTAITTNTSVIGAEEPILSRLGLTQNRLPNNRKGVRLRREKLLPEMLLKSEQNHTSSTNFAFGPTTSMSASSSTTCSPKLRGKSIKAIGGYSADTTSDVIFRIPTRNDILSCVFDDNFYKEVVSNVRNNLLFHLDGKIMGNSMQEFDTSIMGHPHQPQIRSTLVKSPIVVTTMDSEIHAATSLAAVTAFPTLLTAKQFGGDTSSSKIRRPHTKNSWKWKWDNVKKFKLINEGGKIVKKMKHPMLGLRDLSKLDMWTQLTMRQKHELLQQQKINLSVHDNHWLQTTTVAEISTDPTREEKQRINEQLNFILDMRLLPHIILEQTEQAIIKLENDEFGIAPPTQTVHEDCGDNFMAQTFADESFLSMLNLLPSNETRDTCTKLVLSGEWARPRCYLCICCGSKFEKLKSLEEHKMFRHSQILSTHYEVVGRELLNGNLLRHLFIPKKALSRYGNESDKLIYSGAARRLFWHKNETLVREIVNNEESSDSLQSVLHSCATNSPSIKNSSSSTEDCDVDSKHSTTAVLQLIGNSSVVSPTHSIHSCSSSSSAGIKRQLKMQTSLRSTPVGSTHVNSSSAYNNNNNNISGSGCSKCGRKSNGVLDLYRHMLDCSGDYIWSLAKKRKYRYYCGSKKRRPCNKHSILELRKNKNKPPVKSLSVSNDNTTEEGAVSSSNFTKIKTSPRSRPSDAESIKKMLENLPPKRICKKIFPTLNKTKKVIKKIKPKILAKHKIYHSLRKTRVRQMQAAKILSKTKSQLKKPKKIATRSSTTTLSSKASTNISNKNKKTIKRAMKKSCERKLTENPIANEDNTKSNNKVEKFKDEVDCCSIKTESELTKDVFINETIATDTPKVSEENTQITNKSCDNPKEIFEQLPLAKNLTNPTTIQVSETVLNTNGSTVLKDVPIEAQSKDNLDKAVPVSTVTPTNSERNPQVNIKTVKRSKRISDCIAMLTGKLEEKLKTEQSIPAVLPVTEKKDVVVQPIRTLTFPIPPKPTINQSTEDLSKPAENVEIDKSSPKKTPKRKAISRRIIKSDTIDSSIPLPVLTASLENKANVKPKITHPVEIMIPPKLSLPIKQTTAHQISPAKDCLATTASAKKPTDLIFSPLEKKRPTNFIPVTVSTSMPPPAAGPSAAPTLMPKMPLFISLDNVRQPPVAPHITPMALPIPLPAPVPVPISIENISQPSPSSLSTSVAALGSNMISTPVMPIIAAVPAHLAIPPALQLTVSPFNAANAEPLNLSSSSKQESKQSQDLSCASIQRISGIPARRQTICGFEVRNFAVFDEMEPLDLSKKPRPEKTAIASHFPPRQIEMVSLLLPPPQPHLAVQNEKPALALPPLTTSEALLNKHFYSNLDLLRIPQVRNPVGGQGTICTNEPVQPPLFVNTSPVMVHSTKTANKKRSKSSGLQATINANIPPVAIASEGLVSNSSNITKSNSNAKDSTNTNSKKESSNKNKSVIRMDEEVINHIDDAINSVINAVKASLDSEEALKAQEIITLKNKTTPFIQLPPSQPLLQIKTSEDVNAAKESVGEFKYLTAARRNMRSKTLDCRPAALNKTCAKKPSANLNQQVVNVDAISSANTSSILTTVTPSISLSNKNDEITQVNECSVQVKLFASLKDQGETKSENKKNETPLKLHADLESKFVEHPINEHFEKQNDPIIEEPSAEKPLQAIIVENCSTQNLTNTSKPSEENVEAALIPEVTRIEDSEAKNNASSIITNTINLDLEHMSNNNNTSSGFHSSAQSDQQISVMSTSTSAVSLLTTATGADTKKKQRRRRKNELAAIVADQLLESFKIDKARRDNLKKLENLAYEKSEDLLLTGMMLMSSTKRNVTSSSSSNIHSLVENTESSAKRTGKPQRNNQNSEIHKQNDGNIIDNKILTESAIEKSVESDKDPLDVGESVDGKKTNRRRQYRRRVKTLDNENISKLKSSLESFSIDIERQLTEYEAKNVNVFKNVQSNENAKQSCSSKNQASANANKSSIILRPSILSVTLEASANQEIPQSTTKTLANDNSKTVVSSRDPRLNKNIHKEGEKNTETICTADVKEPVLTSKNSKAPEEIGDMEEDNYLTEIAKNVNEKIMSNENEEFAFKNDGFELVNDMGMEDSNSKFSRPPTSMSVRSAPNFNDDRSNFGSICDENTNTEVMDMDLDDEMSVYTSYSQDLGRGRGRRRRRRRSILLTRKPKKKASNRDMSTEKIECILCKKVFYSANSLSKHNMTLAHVSKVSEQEYLLSKSHSNVTNSEELQTYGTLGPYARRSTRRSTISEPLVHARCELTPSPPQLLSTQTASMQAFAAVKSSQNLPAFKATTHPIQQETHIVESEVLKQNEAIDNAKCNKTSQKPTTKEQQVSDHEYDVNMSANTAYNGNSRLNLNPDERLFFECCNILKSAETPRLTNAATVAEDCNINANFSYAYNQQEKSAISNINITRPPPANNLSIEPATMRTSSNVHTNHNQLISPQLANSNMHAINQQTSMQQTTLFRDPQLINQLSCYNKGPIHDNRIARSPTYSGISHLSAVTNTTSRFKTKAAMKGYENVKIDLNQQQESKSRTICKLTELAEIALGNEEKPNSHNFSPIRSDMTPPQVSSHIIHLQQTTKENIDNVMCPKVLATPEYVTTLVTENIRECNAQLPTAKNNETRSSTSSKTIMHSSIIKAAVEEHQKVQISNKIIIPDRPFKNIGLEEKETITFQKPKAPAVNLLTEDNNSVSTGSFSDRDDYDFGSLSCDDEVSLRESNDKNQKNNSTESSSESSRATAKTFENKSLIMGRIFKNASTKAVIKTSAVNTVKVKSVGVQKDQIPVPKADMNQLFDELRGNSGVDGVANDKFCNHTVIENSPVIGVPIGSSSRANHKQYQQQRENLKSIIPAASPPAVVSSTTATLPANARKTKTRVPRAKANAEAKTRKDISKLQTELGMSPDEIKKLIDEGQRKSKRRCATNRPKKLIEMWSSDEYEEFLSTKDIIALIEEKEQQEKRKKRKNSVNTTASTNEKEILPDVTSSTKDLKRRNTRRMSIAAESPENLLIERDEILIPPKNTKAKKAIKKREEPVSTTAIITNASKIAAGKKIPKVVTEKVRGRKPKAAEVTENSSTLTTSDNNNTTRKKRSNNKASSTKSKNKTTQKPKQKAAAKESSRAKHKKRQFEDDDESNEDASDNDSIDDDDDDDFLISELKNRQNKTRCGKVQKRKSIAPVSATNVTTTATAHAKPSKHSAIPRETPTKKRSNTTNANCNNSNIPAASSSNLKNLQQQHNQTPAKCKRKNLSNQSPPRRKRLATEKLYYWSSSSDEDFGRINNNKSNPPVASYDAGGEQYQKHGWIVGDSHKKLVTLLAIAKGNKKIDSNSGVKKNIGKKRN